jgi:hypothetical protein
MARSRSAWGSSSGLGAASSASADCSLRTVGRRRHFLGVSTLAEGSAGRNCWSTRYRQKVRMAAAARATEDADNPSWLAEARNSASRPDVRSASPLAPRDSRKAKSLPRSRR